jgi:hypothetical protein
MIPKSLPSRLDPGVVFRFSDQIMRKNPLHPLHEIQNKAPRDFRGAFFVLYSGLCDCLFTPEV